MPPAVARSVPPAAAPWTAAGLPGGAARSEGLDRIGGRHRAERLPEYAARLVATVLVCEPNGEIRDLLARVIGRLGHEAVFPNEDGGAPGAVDVLVVEPGDPWALATARIVRLAQDGIPIVAPSIYPPTWHTRRLRPVAHLVKPFSLRRAGSGASYRPGGRQSVVS